MLVLLTAVVACESGPAALDADAEITMENIDEHIDRPGAKYVDLRNVEDKYTAGYVQDALEALGYTKVYNAGGLSSYSGDNRVLGDPEFSLAGQL